MHEHRGGGELTDVVAVRALQGRTCHDPVVCGQPVAYALEPWPTVVVVKRGAGGHLLHVCLGVKIITVSVRHVQTLG